MKRYCVIGAGAAGVSALHQLRVAGYNVDCFEQTDRVGGHWHTDYEALHLITSRDMTAFENFPMPASYPHFPRREEVASYIESYAREHRMYEAIQFSTSVQSVVPTPTDGATGSAGWIVTTNKGTSSYDGVLIANGHLWDPKLPLIPGTFDGKQLHSSEYKNTRDVAGTRVLVVGAGNSGCDLAVDVAQHRLEAEIVVNQGKFFQAKTYFGRPRQEVDLLKNFSPQDQDLLARLLAKVSIGDNSDYPGLPVPDHKSLADGPVVINELLLYWIQHGRVRVRPGIERFEGKTVYFEDGTYADYDTILWATGFHSSLPFLDDKLVHRVEGSPVRFAAGILPQGLEKIYYIGLTAPRGPQIPIYGLQSKIVARMIALHEKSGPNGAGICDYLSRMQEPESRIDIVRDIWLDQLEDTKRLLDEFAYQSSAMAEV